MERWNLVFSTWAVIIECTLDDDALRLHVRDVLSEFPEQRHVIIFESLQDRSMYNDNNVKSYKGEVQEAVESVGQKN